MKSGGAYANVLWALTLQLLLISPLTFGGGVNTAVPELERQVVEVRHWMDARTFADLFAIAQAAPGPNMLVVSAIGLKVAGIAGAFVATLAICAPTCVITFVVSHYWEAIRASRWRAVIQQGVAPASAGLILASAFLIARGADHGLGLMAITAAVAAFTYFTRFNPLWVMGAAAAVSYLGWIR